MSNNSESYIRAEKQVKKKIGFYIHLTVYTLVNILLIVLDLRDSSDSLWFFWPLIGWGIGLGFHALAVFGAGAGTKMKQKMIQRELERDVVQEHASI